MLPTRTNYLASFLTVSVLLAIWPSDFDMLKLAGVEHVEASQIEQLLNKYYQQLSATGENDNDNANNNNNNDQIGQSNQQLSDDNEHLGDQNNSINTNKQLSPIVLVPGYGGSRLEAKWNKTHVEHYFCEAHSDWTNIWIDVKQLLPFMIDCLIEDFRLMFNQTTNTTHNTPHVQIRVKDPEDISSVEYLNDFHISSFSYFAQISSKLVQNLGYKRNYNIRGAPYDFRKAPNELQDYFKQLKFTSEKMFHESGETQVTFICHSMGCNNVLYFMQQQTKAWKDRHVKRIISIAAPWGGSLSALRATALGDNLGMPYLFDEAKLNKVQRSLPSTIYLFPHVRAFANAPLIRTHVGRDEDPNKVEIIRVSDYKKFFDKIHHSDGYKMWLQTKDLLGSLEAPGVELWCLYGRDQKTLGRLEFEGDFPDSRELDLYDDGDGTVTTQSSKFCQQWSTEQSQPIHLKGFSTNHINILRNPEVLASIESIIKNNDDVCDLNDSFNNEILS